MTTMRMQERRGSDEASEHERCYPEYTPPYRSPRLVRLTLRNGAEGRTKNANNTQTSAKWTNNTHTHPYRSPRRYWLTLRNETKRKTSNAEGTIARKHAGHFLRSRSSDDPRQAVAAAGAGLRVGEPVPLGAGRWHGGEPRRDLRRRVHAGVREHRAEAAGAGGLAAGVGHDVPALLALHRFASGFELASRLPCGHATP